MPDDRLQNTINELLERANKAILDLDWESVKKSSETVLDLYEGNQEAKNCLSFQKKIYPQPNLILHSQLPFKLKRKRLKSPPQNLTLKEFRLQPNQPNVQILTKLYSQVLKII